MHYIYICTRSDPEKVWVMCHFQITLAEIEALMAKRESGWRKVVPLEDIVESEPEEGEEDANKKDEEEYDDDAHTKDDTKEEDAGKEVKEAIINKPTTCPTQKGKGKKKRARATEMEIDALDQEMIDVLRKQKLPLADLGSTPKKARGFQHSFPKRKRKLQF